MDEHRSIDFLWEIPRIDYGSLKSGDLAFWTKYVDSPHSVTDKFVYERFYAKFLANEAFRVTNDLMGGDPWPNKEKRARVLVRYPEGSGYTWSWAEGAENERFGWTTPAEIPRTCISFFGGLG